MKNKKIAKLLSLALMLLLVLTSCTAPNDDSASTDKTDSSDASSDSKEDADSSDSSSDDDSQEVVDPMAKYDEVVTVSLAFKDNAASTDFDGYTVENSPWTKMLLEEYNIKVEYLWTSTEYSTKFDLAMAGNELPDIIETPSYTQFDTLVQNDKLADLTGYFEDYLRPEYQDYVLNANPNAITNGTYDGKVYGYSFWAPAVNNGRMVMIREDWMKELNIEAPKTMEEVIEIGKKFVDEGYASFAFPLNKDIAVTSDMNDITAVANANGAYPKIWRENENGELAYGSIQPEMKAALQVYADLYAGGYIDPAFASLDGGKTAEQLTSDQIGITVGPFWLISWPLNSLYESQGVNWSCYPMPASETYDGTMYQQIAAGSSSMFCVNKDFEHPEAAFKILNAVSDKLQNLDPEVQATYHSYVKDDGTTVQLHMITPFDYYIDDPMTNMNVNKHTTEAFDSQDESCLITAADKLQYPKVAAFHDALDKGEKPATSDWVANTLYYGDESAYGIVNQYSDAGLYVTDDRGGYVSDTMAKQMGNLEMLEDQYIVEIITGVKTVEEGFDEFVETWNALGGADITKELNEWYSAK